MSDLRKDPLLDQWVIVAANRAQRPGALIESPPFEPGLPCPFCEGHEHETPPELLAFRPAAQRGRWAAVAGAGRAQQVSRPRARQWDGGSSPLPPAVGHHVPMVGRMGEGQGVRAVPVQRPEVMTRASTSAAWPAALTR